MTNQRIAEIVAAALAGNQESFLQEVVDHGIHNLTNEYNGETDDEYQAFSHEFSRQAAAALAIITTANETDPEAGDYPYRSA